MKRIVGVAAEPECPEVSSRTGVFDKVGRSDSPQSGWGVIVGLLVPEGVVVAEYVETELLVPRITSEERLGQHDTIVRYSLVCAAIS